jgi:hypothetical protein
LYQLLLLLGSEHQEEEKKAEEEAELSEDGEILSDDESFKSIPIPPVPQHIPERTISPESPIEYDVPMWRPLVSFPSLDPSFALNDLVY